MLLRQSIVLTLRQTAHVPDQLLAVRGNAHGAGSGERCLDCPVFCPDHNAVAVAAVPVAVKDLFDLVRSDVLEVLGDNCRGAGQVILDGVEQYRIAVRAGVRLDSPPFSGVSVTVIVGMVLSAVLVTSTIMVFVLGLK